MRRPADLHRSAPAAALVSTPESAPTIVTSSPSRIQVTRARSPPASGSAATAAHRGGRHVGRDDLGASVIRGPAKLGHPTPNPAWRCGCMVVLLASPPAGATTAPPSSRARRAGSRALRPPENWPGRDRGGRRPVQRYGVAAATGVAKAQLLILPDYARAPRPGSRPPRPDAAGPPSGCWKASARRLWAPHRPARPRELTARHRRRRYAAMIDSHSPHRQRRCPDGEASAPSSSQSAEMRAVETGADPPPSSSAP